MGNNNHVTKKPTTMGIYYGITCGQNWDISRDTVYTSNNNMGLVRFGRSGNGGFTPNIIRLFRLNTGVTYLLTSNCSGVHSFRETHEQAGQITNTIIGVRTTNKKHNGHRQSQTETTKHIQHTPGMIHLFVYINA